MLSEQDIKNVYRDLAPKLTNYLVANGLEYGAACDIVQETFILFWKKSKDFSVQDSISGFVFAVAKNLRIDAYRRNKYMVYQREITDENAGITDSPTPKNAADLTLVNQEHFENRRWNREHRKQKYRQPE